MKFIIITLFSILITTQSYASVRHIIPYPKDLRQTTSEFVIRTSTPIALNNDKSEVATHAIQRLQKGIAYRTHIFLNALSNAQKVEDGIMISYDKSSSQVLVDDESYELIVEKNAIRLTSASDLGLVRGVETLLQLVQAKDSLFVIPCVTINDSPRFKWRGLLIDASRHFMPIDVLKRNLDAMASVKLNVLHLHLSDDQGWRLESKRYPALHEKASNGDYYTHAQITDLVHYAKRRGIEIIPEIDIPGHTSAFLTAFPELASADEAQNIKTGYGIMLPVIDPTNEQSYTVLSNVFREIDSLFPGNYIHIGGDEVKPDQWENNESITAFMKQKGFNPQSLQNYFLQRVADSLKQFNRQIIGWDEIFVDGLPKASIVHAWRNKNVCYQAAKNGYKTIVSNGFYLDLLYPAKNYYTNEVIESNAGLSAEQEKNILGGEACMWSELVDARTIDSRIWPSLGAVAENLWSPAKQINKKDLLPRLAHLSNSLNEFKLRHQSSGYAILHEIAGSEDVIPLVELKNICEPVTGYLRHSSYNYTTSTPLNFFADALSANAPMILPFSRAVDEFIVAGKNPENFDLIADKLYEWAGFYEYYKSYFESNSELQKLAPLAKKLSDAAGIADVAMQFAVKGRIPKKDWIENAKQVIEEAKQPVDGVKLAIIDDLERLMSFSKDHDVIEF